MRIEKRKITPEYALQLLANNTHNRDISPADLRKYVCEMAHGRWMFTHHGMAIAPDGTIIDGQHRLMAVVQSGVTIECYIMFDAEPEIQAVIDCGRSRTVAENMSLNDDVNDAKAKVSAIRSIVALACGKSVQLTYGTATVVFQEFERELEFVTKALGGYRPAKKAWMMGALAFALKASPKLKPFISAIGTGEDLHKGDPAKTIRDWLISSSTILAKNYKMPAIETILNAAYNFEEGTPITATKSGAQGISYYLTRNAEIVAKLKAEFKQQLEVPAEKLISAPLPSELASDELAVALNDVCVKMPKAQVSSRSLVAKLEKRTSLDETTILRRLPKLMATLFGAAAGAVSGNLRGYTGAMLKPI